MQNTNPCKKVQLCEVALHFGNLENEYFLKSPIFYVENDFVIALFNPNFERFITNADNTKMCKENKKYLVFMKHVSFGKL